MCGLTKWMYRGLVKKKLWYKRTSFFRLEKLRYNAKLVDYVWNSKEENGKITGINWSHVMRPSGRISYILQLPVKFRSVICYLKRNSQEIEKILLHISFFLLDFTVTLIKSFIHRYSNITRGTKRTSRLLSFEIFLCVGIM